MADRNSIEIDPAVSRHLLEVVVSRKTIEAEDICSLELLAPVGRPLPGFSAGAHIDLHVPGGYVRQYSLCNDPNERGRYVIAVLKDANSRGGSQAVHEAINVGDRVTIGAPRNQFPLENVSKTLFFAGGIGITPILSMVRQISRTNRRFAVHYCARSREKAAFVEELERTLPEGRFMLHLDNGPTNQKLDIHAVLSGASHATHLYVCGPQGFIDWIVSAARERGWPPEHIHVEYFKAEVLTVDGDMPFTLQLSRSGASYIVPVGVSAAAVLIGAGHDLPVSCESGFCGTCLTRVLDGIPDHRDTFLTDDERAENDRFTPCCSRARTQALVIDL